MKIGIPLVLLLSFVITTQAFATDDQMKASLVKMIEALQAIKPLIDEAAAEQPSNPRVMIHFDNWVDGAGVKHLGLKADLDAIQQALITAVNRETIEPRVFAPLTHDFVGDSHV